MKDQLHKIKTSIAKMIESIGNLLNRPNMDAVVPVRVHVRQPEPRRNPYR